MQILVTRPRADAERFAGALRAQGHTAVLAPLLDIQSTDDPPPDGMAGAVLLFTSANGVRAAAARLKLSLYHTIAVGKETGEALRSAGATHIDVAGGDVAALADFVANAFAGRSARFVHVAGSVVAGDLGARLGEAGFAIRRWTAYRAVAAEKLPTPAEAFLEGPSGGIALFSPRTARIFIDRATAAGKLTSIRRHQAFCLSAQVAAAAGAVPWAGVVIAHEATQEGLLKTIGDAG